MTAITYSLAELCICAASEAWHTDGEVMATGITVIPRLAASLAKLTSNSSLMITDAECYLVNEPVPVGPRGSFAPVVEGWIPYSRMFDLLWGGRRHAMVLPTQLDRFGQSNLSAIGGYAKPQVALLGVRGLPGNTIHHANSFFIPNHSTRTLVAHEVDMVGGIGYNPARWPGGSQPRWLDLRLVVTDLAALDFGGPNNQIRVRSLHPGVSFEHLQDNTGFPIFRPRDIDTTAAPNAEQLRIIREVLDPHRQRESVFKGNPPGDRRD